MDTGIIDNLIQGFSSSRCFYSSSFISVNWILFAHFLLFTFFLNLIYLQYIPSTRVGAVHFMLELDHTICLWLTKCDSSKSRSKKMSDICTHIPVIGSAENVSGWVFFFFSQKEYRDILSTWSQVTLQRQVVEVFLCLGQQIDAKFISDLKKQAHLL